VSDAHNERHVRAARGQVKAYLFNGYWEDIGTIKSFFEENLKLAQQ
jgi:glucose-1-phosphate adenylyltransferase